MLRAGELCELLHRTLPDVRFDLASARLEVVDQRPDIALLTTPTTVGAFVMLDGSAEAEYISAFAWFKEAYSEHLNQWGRLDPLLILVRGRRDPGDDAFYNHVETDPYFCRKFVLEFEEGTEFRSQLWRLPFVPLPLFDVSTYKRKIPARRLVRESGVSAEYAYNIVQPGERSAEGLVDDYLEEKHKDTAEARSRAASQRDGSSQCVQKLRLTRLEMTGFRAYAKRQEFDLDADIVVLYGQNGLGKTSFFDAIDFLFTGEIGRLSRGGRSGPSPDGSPLVHRGVPLADSRVAACVCDEGRTREMNRLVSTWSSLKLDDQIFTQRKDGLLATLGLTELEIEPGIKDLSALFRATHFFGQEYVELMPDLLESSRLKPDTITRLLALQDYANAAKKLDEVIKVLDSRVAACVTRLDDLTKAKQASADELKSLKFAVAAVQVPEDMLERTRRVATKAKETVGLTLLSSGQMTPDVLRSWSVALQEHADIAARRRRAVSELSERLPTRDVLRRDSETLKAKLSVRRAASANLQEESDRVQRETRLAESETKALLSKQQELMSSRRALEWWSGTSDTRAGLLKRLEELRAQLRLSAANVEEATAKVNSAQSEWSSRNASIEQLRRAQAEAQVRLNEIKNLEPLITEWMGVLSRLEKVDGSIAKAKKALDDLSRLAVANSRWVTELAAREKEQRAILNGLSETHTAGQQLIDTALSFATDSLCPVCGADHGSKEALVAKMRGVRGSVSKSLGDAELALRVTEQDLRESHGLLDETNSKLEALQRDVNEFLDQRARLDTRASEIRGQLNSFCEASDPQKVSVWVKNVTLKLQQESQNRLSVIPDSELALQRSATALTSATTRRDGVVRKHIALTKEASETEDAIRAIEVEAADRGVDPTRPESSVLQGLEFQKAKEVEIQQRLGALASRISELKNASERSVAELAKAREDADAVAMELVSMQARLADLATLMQRENLRDDPGWLIGEDQRLDVLLANFSALVEEVTRLEVAWSAAEKTASMTLIERRQSELQEGIAAAKAEQRRLCTAKEEFFERLRRRVDKVQHEAIGEYVESFGPLASVIQSRLRPVYGFGPMRLTAKGSEVEVSVEGSMHEALRPHLYFSQSQLQTAMLSLYLSAAYTQEWSPLSTVLLDDPVTHFDDLNSYALLDLLKGLVGGGNERQFIISTCEDRLYRLMRRKFGGLNAKFYEFKSIGADGPVVVPGD